MELNLDDAVNYHYDKFPPTTIDYGKFIEALVNATDAVARYDQMLKNMYNSEILLAPLRNQEAVISSRIEGTISTIDEILKYEADHDEELESAPNVRSEIKKLYEKMKVVFADTLSSKWSFTALDYIFTNPVFRNNKFTNHSGIPKTTAKRFTPMLLEQNLITVVEEASGSKPALYSFEPLIQLVRV